MTTGNKKLVGRERPRDRLGRFTKGHSGNPNGRPKLSRNWADLFAEALTDEEFVAGVKAMAREAAKGRTAAQRLMFEYTIGKPQISVDVSTAGARIDDDMTPQQKLAQARAYARALELAVALEENTIEGEVIDD